MANETLSTSISGIIQDIKAETLFLFNTHAGILDTVNHKDLSPTGGLTAVFSVYSSVSSSDVSQPDEGAAISTNKEILNTPKPVTVARNGIATLMTDQAEFGAQSTNTDVVADASLMFGDGLLAAVESEIVGLYTGFSTSVSGISADTALTLDNIYAARAALRSAKANMRDLVIVLSPKQYEGAFGLRNAVSDTGTGNAGTNMLSEEFLQKGFVDVVAGMQVLVSNEIDESGSSAIGAIYERHRAIGFASNGLVRIEMQRIARKGAFDLVASGYWKALELNDTLGIKLISKI